MFVNPKLREIADRQWGFFTARQASESGYASSIQSYHVRHGNWVKCERALYRLPGYSDTIESEFAFWSLRLGGNLPQRTPVITHQSALFFYGLSSEKPERTHLTVATSASLKEYSGCCLHLGELKRMDYNIHKGFRITTVFKTLDTMRPELLIGRLWAQTMSDAFVRGLITENERAVLVGIPVSAVETSQSFTVGKRPEIFGRGREIAMARGYFPASRSFTLVEMLIVIMIMSVLAALLMPALLRARESARQATCLNNLKGMGICSATYSDDNNGFIMPAVKELTGLHGSWMSSLLPYLLPNGGFSAPYSTRGYQIDPQNREYIRAACFCPVSTFTKGVTFDIWCDPMYLAGALSYGVNTFNGIPGNTIQNWSEIRYYFGKVTKVKSPSAKFSMTEIAINPSGYNRTMIVPSCDNISYRHQTALLDNMMDTLKLGVANASYVDGHCNAVSYLQVKDFQLWSSSSKFAALGY